MRKAVCWLLWVSLVGWAWGQQASNLIAVPTVIRFGGSLADAHGQPLGGVLGVTFSLYTDRHGGAPLWMETQNLQADGSGHYSVTLGSTSSQGLPQGIFTSGEARWLGVQVQGQAEQPRVLLVAVPYALKAADAETIGGLPPSAFLLAAPAISSGVSVSSGSPVPSSSGEPPAMSNVTTTGGTVNAIPLFTTATNIQNSAITQTGSGATSKIGIGTTTPAAKLDVKGAATVRGALTLPATGAATATAGKNSQPQDLVASSFNSTTDTAVNQTFQWRAEPAANNTANPSGTLNLLYGLGATMPTETGLNVGPTGQITFATGQKFPGTGTITGVTAGTDLTGGGTTGGVTLNLDTTKVPQLTANNSFVGNNGFQGNQTMNGYTDNSSALEVADYSPDGGYGLYGQSTNGTGIRGDSLGTAVEGVAHGTSGLGVYGAAIATSGSTAGVGGTSQSPSGVGVFAIAYSTTGNTQGVFGSTYSPAGVGVFGQQGTFESSTGKSLAGTGVGTWGDGGTIGNFGVLGTTDNGPAGLFENNSANFDSLYARNTNALGFPFFAQNLTNNTYCNVDAGGDLNCTGTKNAVVPIDGGARVVALSAIESPKNWFEDFGSAALSSGSAVVALDPDFIQTVNTEREYMVIPVPNGECKGLYVTNKTATSFEVRELGGGISSIRFDYRIVALRRKYEDVRFADHTNDPDPRKMMERMKSARPQGPASHKSPTPLAPMHAAKLAPIPATTPIK
jgi:hypothetical protein